MAGHMVKCLICGAVFEQGVAVCPVCGVGPENFVPVEQEKTAFQADTDQRFLVLGTGTAALSAATAIRERNADCQIVMVSNERALPYNRPMLTKNLLHNKGRDAFAIHGASWYKERNIQLITDEIVSSLDTVAKTVGLSNDTVMEYDKCIYALGARSFIPPFPGAHLPETVSIRTIDDAQRIATLLPTVKEAVVIGGGVLGLEAAWEICQAGVKVTVLEAAERLMPRQLDKGASDMLKAIAEKKGIAVLLNAKTQEILGEAHVEGVALADGTSLPAQMVVISTGVRANTKIAQDAGLAVERAVVVNAYMESSAKDVYACGDCAEFESVNYAVWPEATRMGEVAGANAAGERLAYKNITPGLTLNALGTSLFAIGDVGSKPDVAYRVESQVDEAGMTCRADYYIGEKRVGGVRIGDLSDVEALMEDMAQ